MIAAILTILLSSFYTSNVDIDIRVVATHFRLSGVVKVDADLPGMYASIYGDDPNHWFGKLNETVVVEPNGSEEIVWDVQNGVCSEYGKVPAANIPLFELPDKAVYRGEEGCDLQNPCKVYRVEKPYADVTYVDVYLYPYIQNKVNTSDVILLKAEYTGSSPWAYFTIHFYNFDHIHSPTYWFRKPIECK